MITQNGLIFPNNVVELIATRAQLIDPDLFVVKRPLRATDKNQSIGVSAAFWTPNNESHEMRGATEGSEPTISNYTISIQAFIKHMDEVVGLDTHAYLSKLVRTMLYRDRPLALALRSLKVNAGAYTEQMLRWGIRRQNYFSNELNAEWLYLSTLEFWFETETV